jgi:hypothetical protein
MRTKFVCEPEGLRPLGRPKRFMGGTFTTALKEL